MPVAPMRSDGVDERGLRDVVTSPERRSMYISRGLWDGAHLSHQLAIAAKRQPEKVAVVDLEGRRTHTFAQLDADATRVAAMLRAGGIHRGDVVTVQLPNWYETVAIDLGVLRAGAVLNPVLPIYRYRELRHVLDAGAVRVLFTPTTYRGFDHAELAARLCKDASCLDLNVVIADPTIDLTGFRRWLGEATSTTEPVELDAADVSELIFTSGTESIPKAIMHTEQTANFSVRTAAASLGMFDDDVVWMPSPVGHSTGFNYGVRMAIYHGLTLVLQDRWDAEVAANLIETYRCSYAVAATTFVSDLNEFGAAHGSDLTSMRLFGSGGATVPA